MNNSYDLFDFPSDIGVFCVAISTETRDDVEGLLCAASFDKPPRRFWNEKGKVDQEEEWQRLSCEA